MKTTNSNRTRDSISVLASELTSYSYEYCRLVRNGKRNNQQLFDLMQKLDEGIDQLKEEIKKDLLQNGININKHDTL